MVAELSALQQIVNALTGLNGLPAVIVQCAVTTTYTCMYLIQLQKENTNIFQLLVASKFLSSPTIYKAQWWLV